MTNLAAAAAYLKMLPVQATLDQHSAVLYIIGNFGPLKHYDDRGRVTYPVRV